MGAKTALERTACASTRRTAHDAPVRLGGARLPSWFLQRFPAEYHRKRLFNEKPEQMLGVTRFESRDDAPLVSAPEQWLFELLDEVGVRQPLQEAR